MRTWLVALTLLAAPAGAQELPFQAVAGQARMLLATSGPLADALDPASRAVLGKALVGPEGLNTDPLWERLMAGALQLRREQGMSAQTLWFNPLLDAGLLLRWTKDGSGWQIVQAAAVTGEALRGAPAGDGLGWTQQEARLSTALRRHGLASFRAAEAADWTPLFARAQRAEVLRRAARAEVSVEALQATPGYEMVRPLLAELLVTGNPAGLKLPAAMVESLNEMGERARLQLGTASAFRLEDGWTLALQSASAPGVTWLVTFADGSPALPVAFTAIGMEDK
jgi:hypothetical protein